MRYLFVLLVFMLFTACLGFKQGAYSFEEGFKYMSDLDFKHQGNFKTERIDMNFVDLKKIEGFQTDLQAFKNRIEQDPDAVEKNKLLRFIEARKQMLSSERFYQLGLTMGNFSAPELRPCDKKKEMEFAFKYFLEARKIGVNATDLLDQVLQDFEPAQRLVGVHAVGTDIDERPRFYLSHWDDVTDLIGGIGNSLNACLMQDQ